MLRSAPFLVIYAEFLLLSAYIYSMNLTEDELPSKIQNINLAQIGFQKILVLPVKPLLVKCLYTTMFWLTLRQFMHERQEARQSSALADMVAPLQVTVGAATTGSDSKFFSIILLNINYLSCPINLWCTIFNKIDRTYFCFTISVSSLVSVVRLRIL